MLVSLGFDGAQPLANVVELSMAAEESGWHGVWCAEHLGLHDGVVAATAVAQRSSRLRIGLVGPSVASRHPGLLAMELSSLAELSGGRLRVQVGVGDLTLAVQAGGATPAPLGVTEAFVEVLRRLSSGETVSRSVGPFVLNEFRLSFPVEYPIDVMAIGPRMRRLAATVGDGLALSVGASRSYISDAVDHARLAAGDRPLHVTAFAYAGVADTIDVARHFVSRKLAFLPPQLLLDLAGPSTALPDVDALREAGAGTGAPEAARLLATSAIDDLALVATVDTLGDVLDSYRTTGIDELALFLAAPTRAQNDLVRGIGDRVGEASERFRV